MIVRRLECFFIVSHSLLLYADPKRTRRTKRTRKKACRIELSLVVEYKRGARMQFTVKARRFRNRKPKSVQHPTIQVDTNHQDYLDNLTPLPVRDGEDIMDYIIRSMNDPRIVDGYVNHQQ